MGRISMKEGKFVPSVDNLSIEDFESKYLNAEKPVLIKNYMKEWPALKWNIKNLKEKAGHNEVFVRRNTAQESYKTGKKYNIQSMLFSDYIGNIEANNAISQSSYLAVQNIRKALPELVNDIEIPKYVKKVHGGPFLWLARKGHYEFCHFDPDDNFLMVLHGKKKVKLFEAKDLKRLYPNPLGSKGKTIQSNVDCDNPDLKMYPKFTNIEYYECTVSAGDMLYFPAFWWHQVTSVELTISMNIFFGNDGTNIYLSKIMEGNQWDSFEYWFLNIIEQNKDKEQFQKVLQYLPETISNFLWKQWKEEPDEKQVDVLVKTVMKYCGLDELPDRTVDINHPPPLKIRGLLWR